MKHILITGSTRGIGYALTKFFIENNCKVTINGTTKDNIKNAMLKLSEKYPSAKIQGFSGDISDYNFTAELWDNAVKDFGEIDIWINNAGIDQERQPAWELQPSSIKRVIDINILGMMYGSVIAMKNMIKQGHGAIYNMEGFGSNNMTMPKLTYYGTSKRALTYYTKSLIKELKDTPINIGTLSPGMVATDFLKNSIDYESKQNIKVFNTLADYPDTIGEFLVNKMLKNNKKYPKIKWLTNKKVMWRFISAPILRRKIF